MDCIFCKLKDYVLENELAYAVFDVMPVNPGHLLMYKEISRLCREFIQLIAMNRSSSDVV